MIFLTDCERCGECSYDDEWKCHPALCPWCHKPKKLWTGEEECCEWAVFTHCNVCGIALRHPAELRMGMCERCADE